jgi:hypothetical protein
LPLLRVVLRLLGLSAPGVNLPRFSDCRVRREGVDLLQSVLGTTLPSFVLVSTGFVLVLERRLRGVVSPPGRLLLRLPLRFS